MEEGLTSTEGRFWQVKDQQGSEAKCWAPWVTGVWKTASANWNGRETTKITWAFGCQPTSKMEGGTTSRITWESYQFEGGPTTSFFKDQTLVLGKHAFWWETRDRKAESKLNLAQVLYAYLGWIIWWRCLFVYTYISPFNLIFVTLP